MQTPSKFALPAALALLMLATRADHFGSSVHLPDASLAVFFLAGFYLRGVWVLPSLLALAGLIDYAAIAWSGVSDFCVTPASYAFLVPAYAAPWMGGAALRGRLAWHWASLPWLAGAWLAAGSVSFFLSGGSFYWLSGRVGEPSWAGYWEQAGEYAAPYLFGPLAYVALAVVLHGLFAALRGRHPAGVASA